MLALNSPELDVRAITVVPGNVTASQGLENALRMVSLANRCDIPIAAGAQHPLFQKLITAEFWHGKNGLANVELPPSKCKVDSHFGPDLIIQMLHAHDAGTATCDSEMWRLEGALERIDDKIEDLRRTRHLLADTMRECRTGNCRFVR